MSATLLAAVGTCGAHQSEIARRTGVSVTTLSRWLRGQRALSVEAVDALADFLDLELMPRRGTRRARRDSERNT